MTEINKLVLRSVKEILHEKQIILILDSVDMCGKTEVANKLNDLLGLPVYKNSKEQSMWQDKLISLIYGQEELTQFLEKTGYSVIFDRFHASEYVYSKVFKRISHDGVVMDIDKRLATLNCLIIYPWKNSNKYLADDQGIVKIEQYDSLKKHYEEFFNKTKCDVIRYNADDEDLGKQMNIILQAIFGMFNEVKIE